MEQDFYNAVNRGRGNELRRPRLSTEERWGQSSGIVPYGRERKAQARFEMRIGFVIRQKPGHC